MDLADLVSMLGVGIKAYTSNSIYRSALLNVFVSTKFKHLPAVGKVRAAY